MVAKTMPGAPASLTEPWVARLEIWRGESSPRMQPQARKRWIGLFMLVCCSLAPNAAWADTGGYRIAVLDLESDDVHDNFAGELTQRLRTTMQSRTGFTLHDTHVSLLQLSLAQNCDPAQAECLGQLAVQLEVDGFIFGKVTHEGGAPVALLRRYDIKSQSVDRTSLVTFTSREIESDELERGAQHLLNDLLGAQAASGEVHAAVLPPAAESATTAPAAKGGGISPRTTLGYALIATSLLAAGMTAVSFIEVYDAEHNANYTRYRYAVGDTNPGVNNVCSEANAGHTYGLDAASFNEAKSSCSMGNTFSVLQYVFLGAAVVTGGVGAYLLATDESEQAPSADSKRTARDAGRSSVAFRLQPNLGFRSGGLSARLSF
jgi:hypothetical protein